MTRGERVVEFIHRYCHIPDGQHVGKPIQLAQFEVDFILALYDRDPPVRRAYLSIARKNGKSSLIACLLLAHLVGPEAQPNSQIVSGARSRDQAALVFDLACKIIRQSDALVDRIRIVPSSKKLFGLPRNVEYKALAAEGKTAHGLSPVVAILDEVGQVEGPRDAFIEAITTSQGAHEHPLLIAISTQAANDGDLFSIWLDDAEKSDDPRIVSHVYAAPEGAEVLDEEAWQAANPGLGLFRSRDDLREQAEQASRMPASENAFRNLCLNQRVAMNNPFVSVDVWKASGAEPEEHPGNAPAWAGLDLSMRTDLTACVIVWQSEGIWQVQPHFWAPEQGVRDRAQKDQVPYDMWAEQGYLHLTPGATVDYRYVAEQLGEILGDVSIQAIAYDRWRIDDFKRQLDEIGLELPLEPFGQGYRDMSPALDAVEAELLNHRVAHGMHPLLGMCATNAIVTTDPSGNRKLDKSKSTRRIDGMVAFAMAMGQAARTPETIRAVSVYEQGVI